MLFIKQPRCSGSTSSSQHFELPKSSISLAPSRIYPRRAKRNFDRITATDSKSMSAPDPSPREMARAFTPQLAKLIENPLYSDVWTDPALSPRDRSIATVAALIALYRPEELPAHLRRARENGVTRDELAALITHMAFYAGFPAAVSASAIAARTLTD
jgi:4-carboxymuconolactone decarboxylase